MAVQPLTGDDPLEIGGYRLRSRLGAGGMGRVYLAFTPGGRPVALKVVRPELGDDEGFRDRFRQEIAAARRVHGLYTAQLLDGDPDAAPPWLVTAYVAGPSLQQAVADHGPVPVASVFLLMAGVAEALQAIHAAGVVHRDLKPSNVLLAPDGPRVIDFGIARALEATALTRTGMRVGSPQFMAPEQVRGGAVSAAADVFALGALAGYAVLGRPPFGEGSESAVLYRVLHEEPDLDGCGGELRALIERCLAKDAAARPEPAEIIDSCRARSAVKTMEFAESWLPPAIAADLTRHAAPAGPAGPATELAGPAGPATELAGPAGDAAKLAASAGAGRQVSQMPPPAGTEPTAARTLLAADGPPHRGRRWLSRTTVIASVAAAVLLAALAGYGVLALASAGDGHAGSHNAAAGGGQGLAASGTRRGTSLKAAPSASPSPSSTLDPCLAGTWKETVEDIPGTVDGQAVTYVGGPGVTQIFTSGGINIVDYGNGAHYTVDVNGNMWTQITKGRATIHYETQDGMLLSSGISQHGSQTVLENGAYNNSAPLTMDTQPDRYTCSGNSLVIFVPNGGSIEMTRSIPHVTPSGS
jgi:Protein kinase domain